VDLLILNVHDNNYKFCQYDGFKKKVSTGKVFLKILDS